MDKSKMTSIQVTRATHRRLKIIACREGLGYTELLDRWIDEYAATRPNLQQILQMMMEEMASA